MSEFAIFLVRAGNRQKYLKGLWLQQCSSTVIHYWRVIWVLLLMSDYRTGSRAIFRKVFSIWHDNIPFGTLGLWTGFSLLL